MKFNIKIPGFIQAINVTIESDILYVFDIIHYIFHSRSPNLYYA